MVMKAGHLHTSLSQKCEVPAPGITPPSHPHHSYTSVKVTKSSWKTTEKHTQGESGRQKSWQAAPRGQCDSVSLNNTNQEPQILIFAVINFIQTSSQLTGFLWESSGNLICL